MRKPEGGRPEGRPEAGINAASKELGVNVTSIVEGEYAENDVRKDFTPSERVAIAAAVAAEIGERRGNGNTDNCPEYKGKETRDIAAEKASEGGMEMCKILHNMKGEDLIWNLGKIFPKFQKAGRMR